MEVVQHVREEALEAVGAGEVAEEVAVPDIDQQGEWNSRRRVGTMSCAEPTAAPA